MSGKFAENCLELIKELESYKGKLPPFQENKLRCALQEIQMLYEQNREEVASKGHLKPEGEAAFHLRHAAIERNKHCVLSYLYNRLMIIKDMRWEKGPVIPNDVRGNMAEQEVVFFAEYSKLLANYMGSLGEGHGLDLFQDLKPPKTLMVEVRVLKDYGEFLLDNGETVLLMTDSVHFLPVGLIETLIQQQIVELVQKS